MPSEQDRPKTFDASLAYPKAIRKGQMVWVGGTTAAIANGAKGDDVVAQTKEILRRISIALHEVEAGFSDVVRVRVFVTDVDRWLEITSLLREAFPHKPAATMIGVKQLVAPWLLAEIEVDAVIQASDT